MTDERWLTLVDHAKKNFENFSYETEDLLVETQDGLEKQGIQEVMQFQNDIGQFKIVREIKPRVLDKKMHFTHQQGQAAQAEYTFSETETVKRVLFFMLDDMDEWQEIEGGSLGMAS